jgi:hypothetical protein
MSQDLLGGGRRAQRDKEFFPEMSESEAAKAKTLMIGATIKKAAAASASSGGSSKASGSEASKKTDAAGGLSASLLVSASMASTVKIQSDSDNESGDDAAAMNYKKALDGSSKRPFPSPIKVVKVNKVASKANADTPDKAGPRRLKRQAEATAKREQRLAAEEGFTGPAASGNFSSGKLSREQEQMRRGKVGGDTDAPTAGNSKKAKVDDDTDDDTTSSIKRKPAKAVSDRGTGKELEDKAVKPGNDGNCSGAVFLELPLTH